MTYKIRKIIAMLIMLPAALLFLLAELVWDGAFRWYLNGYVEAVEKYGVRRKK